MKRQMYANTLFIIFDPFISIKYICLDKWQKMLYYLFGMKNFRFDYQAGPKFIYSTRKMMIFQH